MHQLEDNLFKDCHSLKSLELVRAFDKLNTQTSANAYGLQSLLLRTSAESPCISLLIGSRIPA